jgi:hypothetical protein
MELKGLLMKTDPQTGEIHKVGILEFWKSDETRSSSNESVV